MGQSCRLSKKDAIEIIRNSFSHLFYDENIKAGPVDVLLYFPTIGIAIVEMESEKSLNYDNVEDMNALYIKKELCAKPIYLNLNEPNFNIGYIINDILLEARFEPDDIEPNLNNNKYFPSRN